MNFENNPANNSGEEENKQQVVVRPAKLLVWGPIYITLNLEKTPNKPSKEPVVEQQIKPQPTKEKEQVKSEDRENQRSSENANKAKSSVNILSDSPSASPPVSAPQQKQQENTKKVTYVYNIIDHGLDCECIDVKGELLIRSALPTYRKISQGIEFEQITTNQIKLIITSRVLENYQEVFQGFSVPKATFRVWIMGYKFV